LGKLTLVEESRTLRMSAIRFTGWIDPGGDTLAGRLEGAASLTAVVGEATFVVQDGRQHAGGPDQHGIDVTNLALADVAKSG